MPAKAARMVVSWLECLAAGKHDTADARDARAMMGVVKYIVANSCRV